MSIGGAPPLPTLMRILTEVVVATGILAALVLIGAVGFHFTADLNFTTSIYFTIETLTTVGYGDYDLDLSSTRRRIFVVTYIFFAVPIFAGRLAALIEAVSKYLQMRRIRDMREIGVTRQMLQEADIDLDGSVNRAEFALYFLTKLQIIDMHMVRGYRNE
ncbi:hypothetical protein SARC_08279 [Sphaeroforma arctica JP610]|uniref:Potassium channel domain-containing protein n=1 Tax=Sphaeroforma arctica JP610 TaxID=667725 RepID=A0A0L0FRC9_9EUKA|nr:hypothetical protein SARC_08279 [Sphaeroforma arctica JP610]KNC79330.1 hypothetical protein SARC_08279 [Sphaeroforma arctica JP610]|eukprot:XP_014153232.1 hypothetical protein SARC_08279 [Sphaeroforma arctica JP610]